VSAPWAGLTQRIHDSWPDTDCLLSFALIQSRIYDIGPYDNPTLFSSRNIPSVL